MDLVFRPYRKTTKSRARPLTEEDYWQRGGLIQTIEGIVDRELFEASYRPL